MTCPRPCVPGSFCNLGGAYFVCAAPATWQPLPSLSMAGVPPVCPINPSGAPCELGNSCYVAGLKGRYRCVQYPSRYNATLKPGGWHSSGINWRYQEEIELPTILPSISASGTSQMDLLPSDAPQTIQPCGCANDPIRIGGRFQRQFRYPLRKFRSRALLSK